MQDNYLWYEVNDILSKINWSDWMYNSALSPVPLDFTTTEGTQSSNLADGFIALAGVGAPAD